MDISRWWSAIATQIFKDLFFAAVPPDVRKWLCPSAHRAAQPREKHSSKICVDANGAPPPANVRCASGAKTCGETNGVSDLKIFPPFKFSRADSASVIESVRETRSTLKVRSRRPRLELNTK